MAFENQPEPNRRSRGDSSGGTAEGGVNNFSAGAGAHARRQHVDWERIAISYAEREGTLKTNKHGEPILAAAFADLSAWFIKRLEHRGFGELRDQLVAEFPKEDDGSAHSDGFVEGAGQGVLNNFVPCSGSSHLFADDDEYLTRMNTPVEPRSLNVGLPGVMLNDCDADGHVLTSWVSSYPLHGSLSLQSNGGFTYTPHDGYIGPDMFWYYIIDGYGYNHSAPVSLVVYDADSNNDGDIDDVNSSAGTDDKIEADDQRPGKFIAVNDDDDNGNGVPDHLDAPFVNNLGQPMADDDLVEVELSMMFTTHEAFDDRHLALYFNQYDLRMWDSPQKQNQIHWTSSPPTQPDPPLPPVVDPWDNFYLLGTETLPPSVWIEGLDATPWPTPVSLVLWGSGQGTRDDANVSVVSVDLEIFNGQGASQSTAEDKESGFATHFGRGAFTVANNNDTDGDVRIDSSDDLVKAHSANIAAGGLMGLQEVAVDDGSGFLVGDVIAISLGQEYEYGKISAIDSMNPNLLSLEEPLSRDYTGGIVRHPGRDEVDLMKLVVHRPTTMLPAENVKLTVLNGDIALWTSPTKGAGNAVTLTNGVVEFYPAEIPAEGLTLWVEALSPSTIARDIGIELEFMGASDKVNATAVWATMGQEQVFHDRKTAAQVYAAIPDNKADIGPLVHWIDKHDGTGLLPITADPDSGVHNGILMRFQLLPSGIRLEPVFFDATRRVQMQNFVKLWEGDDWRPLTPENFPLLLEEANDDDIPDPPETPNDESEVPSPTDSIYSYDGPGWHTSQVEEAFALHQKFNFEEWIRVVFTEPAPDGNIVGGSRASDLFLWHARVEVETDAAGVFFRTTGDSPESNVNDVNPGAIDPFISP